MCKASQTSLAGMLDAMAQPTSTKLHTVERLTKSEDGKRVAMKITFTDPTYYSAPFTIDRAWIATDRRHQPEPPLPQGEPPRVAHQLQVLHHRRPLGQRSHGHELVEGALVRLRDDWRTAGRRAITIA